VVEAKREDWSPRSIQARRRGVATFTQRGVADDKAMAAIFTDSMVRFKQENYKPRRGVKLALTAARRPPTRINGVSYLRRTSASTDRRCLRALIEGGGGRWNPNDRRLPVTTAFRLVRSFTRLYAGDA
jgi:hypothetical protein